VKSRPRRNALQGPGLTFDRDDLSGLNGFDVREASGHEGQQVFEAVRLRVEDDNCNLAGIKVLLVFDALIHGEEEVESGFFRRNKEVPVF